MRALAASVVVTMALLRGPAAQAQDAAAVERRALEGNHSLPAVEADGGVAPAVETLPEVPAPRAPVPALAPVVPPAPPPAATPAATPAPAAAPLAGFTGDVAFLRSSDDSFVLLPSGRLQIDGVWSHRAGGGGPYDGFAAKRARLELGGWIGRVVYFTIGGDFSASSPAANQSQLAATDNYIALAPFGDLLILQAGQFNVPFTFENRTSDKYTEFVERSLTVRSMGAPGVRDQGIMLQGVLPRRVAHYAVALMNGDGQNFRNLDSAFDLVGRAWVAPLALVRQPWAERWSRITVGGSGWTGRHPSGLNSNGQALPAQSTLGGFTYLTPKWSAPGAVPMELRQYGRMRAWALELDAPLSHRVGLRAEYVRRHQQLVDVEVAHPSPAWGNATFEGWAAYGQIALWLVGDDRILPPAGLQLPQRVPSWTGSAPPRHGLQALARFEVLRDRITTPVDQDVNDPAVGTTRAWSLQLGTNYWYSKRFRATVDYAFYHLWGTSASAQKLPDSVHELLGRLAIAL